MKKKVPALKFIPLIFFFILPLFLTALSTAAMAETTAGCHCFKDRTYNPADKYAADDYILATSFNSLIANEYNIAKKQIIFLKMKGGIDHMDLIIGLRAARVAQVGFQQLLNLRKQNKSWRQILFDPAISTRIRADTFLRPIQMSGNVAEEGPQIADALIADFYAVPYAEVEKLRIAGLNEKEMSLIFILAKTKGVATEELVEQRYRQNKSWSEIAHELGVAPDQAGKLILGYN